jgi:hypothetical protein
MTVYQEEFTPMADELRDCSIVRSLQEGAKEANGDIAFLERVAKTIATSPEDVVSLLGACLSSLPLLTSLTEHAYVHPNGFAKFVIFDPEDLPVKLRLHVWTGSDRLRKLEDDQNVHGHRWTFASAVIAGQGLDISEFVAVTSGGERYHSYQYKPGGWDIADNADNGDNTSELPTDASELQLVGHVRLDRSVRYTLSPGDAYACDIGTLHTVRTHGNGLTATMVVQGPSLLTSAPVYRRPDQHYQPLGEPMSAADVRSVLGATLEAATAGGPW